MENLKSDWNKKKACTPISWVYKSLAQTRWELLVFIIYAVSSYTKRWLISSSGEKWTYWTRKLQRLED